MAQRVGVASAEAARLSAELGRINRSERLHVGGGGVRRAVVRTATGAESLGKQAALPQADKIRSRISADAGVGVPAARLVGVAVEGHPEGAEGVAAGGLAVGGPGAVDRGKRHDGGKGHDAPAHQQVGQPPRGRCPFGPTRARRRRRPGDHRHVLAGNPLDGAPGQVGGRRRVFPVPGKQGQDLAQFTGLGLEVGTLRDRLGGRPLSPSSMQPTTRPTMSHSLSLMTWLRLAWA